MHRVIIVAEHDRMRAETLSRKEGDIGAIALSRTGDPSLGGSPMQKY